MDSEHMKQARERMEQASLNELMPEFNKENEWQRLDARLKRTNKRSIEFTWLKAAAILVLLAGGSWLAIHFGGAGDRSQVAVQQAIPGTDIPGQQKEEGKIDMDAVAEQVEAGAIDNKTAMLKRDESLQQTNKTASRGPIVRRKKENDGNNSAGHSEQFFNYYLANEFVCNGTQCPIEICIVQTFKCRNTKPSEVATCSTLAPDEAKQLRYKATDKGKDCKVTVDEIRIKRVSTGETIVLNSNSKPSTAEELFSCITGESKCNILAGIFDADCNNHCKQNDLTIYNHQGNVILQ